MKQFTTVLSGKTGLSPDNSFIWSNLSGKHHVSPDEGIGNHTCSGIGGFLRTDGFQ